MIFSLSKKFLFIANLKTASTSIESVLAPHAELRLQAPGHGKHLSYAEFIRNFKWLSEHANMNDVFVFGVIREPVSYMLSLYNSHRGEAFKGRDGLYTGNMDFDQFLSAWSGRNHEQVKPQVSRFTCNMDSRLATNFLISYDRLDDGLKLVAERLQVPGLASLPRLNASPPGLSEEQLLPSQVEAIRERFKADYEAISKYSNQPVGFA